MAKNKKSVKELVVSSVESGGLVPLIKALNPLETIGKTIVEITAYRVEARRLDIEKDRIKAQAEIIGKKLELQLNYKLQELEVNRQSMLACINQINISSQDAKLNSENLAQAMDNVMVQLNQLIGREELPPPTMVETYHETIRFLSEQMVELNKQGVDQTVSITNKLMSMISDTRNELEKMQLTEHNILSLSEN